MQAKAVDDAVEGTLTVLRGVREDLEEGELRADRFAITPSSFHSSAITGLSAYRVRKGDTLYAIARRSGLSVSRLCKINGISARSTLRVGQRLRLN